MKTRAKKAKLKDLVPLDTTQPKRRATSAYMKAMMARYHRETVMPLFARITLLETIIAENSYADVETQKIVIGKKPESWWGFK